MSGSTGPTEMTAPRIDTSVPNDVQARLLDYWRIHGPTAGQIMPGTIWDGGSTTWDGGATTWFA